MVKRVEFRKKNIRMDDPHNIGFEVSDDTKVTLVSWHRPDENLPWFAAVVMLEIPIEGLQP